MENEITDYQRICDRFGEVVEQVASQQAASRAYANTFNKEDKSSTSSSESSSGSSSDSEDSEEERSRKLTQLQDQVSSHFSRNFDLRERYDDEIPYSCVSADEGRFIDRRMIKILLLK